MAFSDYCINYVQDRIEKSEYEDYIVVEIGVAQGESAVKLANLKGIKKFYAIDPWERYEDPIEGFNEGYLETKMVGWSTQEKWDDIHNMVVEKLKPFGDKAEIIRGYSSDQKVLDQVGGYVDFIFLDGNHQYEYVKKDLELWYPKLRKGGFLIADDYGYKGVGTDQWHEGKKYGGVEAYGVNQAVNEFCVENNIQPYRIEDEALLESNR